MIGIDSVIRLPRVIYWLTIVKKRLIPLLTAWFLIATVWFIRVGISREKIAFLGFPVFFFGIQMNMDVGCAFLLDAGSLVMIVTDAITQVAFTDIGGNPLSFGVFLAEDVIPILTFFEVRWELPNEILIISAASSYPRACWMLCHFLPPPPLVSHMVPCRFPFLQVGNLPLSLMRE